jgi:hypothetical protein
MCVVIGGPGGLGEHDLAVNFCLSTSGAPPSLPSPHAHGGFPAPTSPAAAARGPLRHPRKKGAFLPGDRRGHGGRAGPVRNKRARVIARAAAPTAHQQGKWGWSLRALALAGVVREQSGRNGAVMVVPRGPLSRSPASDLGRSWGQHPLRLEFFLGEPRTCASGRLAER